MRIQTGIIIMLTFATALIAQWEPEINISNTPDTISLTSPNNARCIASSENFVHAVWQEGGEVEGNIYYHRSTDNGATWRYDQRRSLTREWAYSEPAVASSARYVHLVYVNNDEQDNSEIYYRRSTDNGNTWGDARFLETNTEYEESESPSIAVSGSNVHVVWAHENNDNGTYEIYYRRSTNNGEDWEPKVVLRSGTDEAEFPSVAVSDSYVHVVWVDTKDGQEEIYYRLSTDNGESWGPEIRLSDTSYKSESPSIAVFGSNVHIVWIDERDGNKRIYYKRSTDNGASWRKEREISSGGINFSCPSVAVCTSLIHIVWMDERDGNKKIYYIRSTDNGTRWGSDTLLSSIPYSSNYPSVASYGPYLHILWTGNPQGGNEEIYYKRNPTGNIWTRVPDVGVLSILCPTETISRGPLIPKARVYNYGNIYATFTTRFSILQDGNAVYSDDTVISNLEPGDSLDIEFTEWIATTPGSYTARCSTYLAGDVSPDNDTLSFAFVVEQFSNDVGVVKILSPTGTIQPSLIKPRAKIHNYGQNHESLWVYFAILSNSNQVYLDSVMVNNLQPESSQEVIFSFWEAMAGEYTTKCTTALYGDENLRNDKRTGSVTVWSPSPPGWQLSGEIPLEPDYRKKIKSGGGMTRCGDKLYILKGNNTRSLYSYIPWEERAQYVDSVPLGNSGKKVKKGSGITSDGRYLYIAKGANTREFSRYDPETKTWETLQEIPPGPSGKSLKGGTGIGFLNYKVYLLKGSKTKEFWSYDTRRDTWSYLGDAPVRAFPNQGYRDGSCLVVYNDTLIYVLRQIYNEFYKYNIRTGSWTTCCSMPLSHPQVNKKKKVKEGAAMTVVGDKIFAFKGGNTCEFWLYDPGQDVWIGRDTIPRDPEGKRVKGGGALATIAGVIWALKGNNTTSIWRYTSPSCLPSPLPGNAPEYKEDTIVELIAPPEVYSPQWSPDGNLIAYFKENPLTGYNQIYIQSLENGLERCLTKIDADCEYPQWSPDSSSICFQIFQSPFYQIAKVDLEGNINILTNTPFDHEYPRYTPDGKYIVYQRDDEDGYNQIFMISAEGGDEIQLTYGGYDCEMPFPYFSYTPSGETILTIAYQKEDGTNFYQIYKLTVDSTGVSDMQLTNQPAEHEYPYPIFLPGAANGFVVYQRDIENSSQIWKVPDDGSMTEIPLTNDYTTDYEMPAFSHNGEWVVCTRWLGETSEIVKIAADGSTASSLTDNSMVVESPQFSPSDSAVVVQTSGNSPEGGGSQGNAFGLRKGFALYQNYPNPFSFQTIIKYQIPRRTFVSLSIYNTAGRLVRRLVNEEQKPGTYIYRWDGKDEEGKNVSAGIYFYRLRAKGFREIKKSVHLR
uniref:T9SS type A sorting domain-containing protein n=1 Tax=candidate division WOR-3 bacterium TaxID=2052148 RepID=A0A7C3UZG7_UNCW3